MFQLEHLKAAFNYHNIIYYIYSFYSDVFIIFRSDYFRNFVDSCLQKIAQDRPTSDVLLKVQGIKRTVWCCTREQAETCDCLFVESISLITHEEIWSVNIVQENSILPFLFQLQLDAASYTLVVSSLCFLWWQYKLVSSLLLESFAKHLNFKDKYERELVNGGLVVRIGLIIRKQEEYLGWYMIMMFLWK